MCVMCSFMHRVDLSMTIVAMNPENNSSDYRREMAEHIPVFRWPLPTRSALLSSFFVGDLLTNVPGALMAHRFQKKTLLAWTTAASSVLATISPPVVIQFGVPALMAIRFVQGTCAGFLFPIIHDVMVQWSPPDERCRLAGFTFVGIPFGTMITLYVAGVLCEGPLGWTTVYYLAGGVGLVWTVAWLLLGGDKLSEHRFIGQPERDYIEASLRDTVSHDNDTKVSDIPWKSIFTSLPFWATSVVHTGHNFGFWLMLIEMPTYIHEVLEFDLEDDGMLSAAPYVAMTLLHFPVSYVADSMNKRQMTTITTSRKVWNTVGLWGSSAGLIALGYAEDRILTIVLYVFTVTILCASNSGFKINHLDLSPNYAGLLIGLTNTFASGAGLLAPLYVGYVITDQTSVVQWRTVFISGAVVMFASNLFFVVYGSAKTQAWNSLNNDKPNMDKTKQEIEIF
ncbi:Hypothetical protein CINCED_3A012145 [Cinara cedri]|nr:Hypothetical protein CINCED_3A012145 [Cinara cedri]